MKKLSIILASLAFTACTGTNSGTVVPVPTPTPTPGTVIEATPIPVATPITAACTIQNSLTQAMAIGVGVAADCKGTDAIQADLNKVAAKLNLCKAAAEKKASTAKGTFGDIACPIFVSALGLTALAQVPASYQCDGGVTLATLEAKLTDLCKKNISI